jgi:hypothetical protein
MRQRASTVYDSKLIENYYHKLTLKLPSDFYQQIVEKENEISLSSEINLQTFNELCNLYKKAIETFSLVSPDKVQFYQNKLIKLIIRQKQEETKVKKAPSKWSQYIKQRQKNANQLMLFLEVEKIKSKITTIMNKYKEQISQSIDIIDNSFQQQKDNMITLKSNKVKNNIVKRKQTTQEVIESNINDFFKKFHYVYMHSKLFEAPVECLEKIFDEVYYHKIQKYYYYQEQIKQFQLLLNDNENENTHHDDLQFYLDDLKKERENYFDQIEESIKKYKETIMNKCLAIEADKDNKFIKYKEELTTQLGNVFK